MQKSALLHALQQEILRHDFSTFAEPITQGRAVTVPGCPSCQKKFYTMYQYRRHLTDDVLPMLIERLSGAKTE